MELQTQLLKSNFQEIYHAVQSADVHALPLVANFSETHIYDSRYGWGRLWFWVYQGAAWFTNKNYRLEKLKGAILHTHTIFHHQLPIVIGHLHTYEGYLKLAWKGYSVKESDYSASRHAITEWNCSTRPFIKMMHRLQNPRMEKLLSYCFGEVLSQKRVSALFSPADYHVLSDCQKIINLEGLTPGPLPAGQLIKILKDKSLNSVEDKELVKWIKKVNKSIKSPLHLHKALIALENQYKKSKKENLSEKMGVIALEVFLEDKGCVVFQQEDFKHLRWLQQLKNGSNISFGGINIVLGNEINPRISEIDHTHVFALEENAHRVALVAQNTTALFIKQFRNQQKNGSGIDPAPILEISPDGRVAIMERLKPLGSIKWTSADTQISQRDLAFVNTLTQLLQGFVTQNRTPSNFKTSQLLFDNQYHLRGLKPATEQSFNFNALEDFVFECAGGNLTIFRHFMEASGLATHSTAKFYHELVASTLKGEGVAVDDLAGIYKITDPEVVDRGTDLAQKVLSLRRQICKKIQENMLITDPKLFIQSVDIAILSCYQATKTAGILWPSILDDVIVRLLLEANMIVANT